MDCFESAREVIGVDEVVEMLPELVMAVVVIALNSCFLDGSVHAFDLPIGPGMFDLGGPVLDLIQGEIELIRMGGRAAELPAVVRELALIHL